MSPMRSLIIVAVLFLTACAGQSNPDGYSRSGDFNTIEAAKTRISLGLTYLKNGNYKQAKVNLDKALEFAPRLADAHYSIAYYYQVVGENQLADDAYRDALSFAPQNADIANSYGAFLCQQGQYENAKAYFLKAVNTSRYAATAETYENLALCSQSQGQIEDAVTYLRTALNHQPSRGKSMLLLSQLLASSGQWTEAKRVLRRYEKVSRVTPETLWLAIKIEQALGNDKGAKGYGDMLLKMFPEHPNSKDYLAKLAAAPQQKLEAAVSQEPAKPKIVKTQKQPLVEESLPAAESSAERPVAQEIQEVAEKVESTVEDAHIEAEEGKETIESLNETPAPIYHIVQKNENLYRISLQYNIKMQRIIEWNNLDDASSIHAGKKIFIVDPQTIE